MPHHEIMQERLVRLMHPLLYDDASRFVDKDERFVLVEDLELGHV
jgi:hypothetical protein